jgi:RNA polymerase sigma factor (sigma-70 family)
MSPEELYEQYQHLAKETIYRMYNNPHGICRKHNIEMDDLLQYARTGLWKACLNHNPEKAKFVTHAINNIKWHLNERLNRETSLIHYAVNRDFAANEKYELISMDYDLMEDEEGSKSYHEIIPSDGIPVLDNVIGDIEGNYMLSQLTYKQREAVELKLKGLNSNEIARILSMTGANVRHHLKLTKKKLINCQLEAI